MLGLIGLIIAS